MSYKCNHKNCNREFDEEEFKFTKDGNKCIFHCDKDKWDKSSSIDFPKIEYFWKEIRE